MSSTVVEGFLIRTRATVVATATTLALGLSSIAQAGGVAQFDAPVVGVVPLYETVEIAEPREVCRREQVAYEPYGERGRRGRSATAPILGAVIGGAIGNAVGSGKRNKQVGVAVGAILGGSIGADIARQQRRDRVSGPVRYRTETICSVEESFRTEQQLTGYRVSYRVNGEIYETVTDYRPGSTIPVRLAVSPLV
ncbi:MAG: glycine zipper domain-containing protein [Pseudomonadota bacterium]